MQELSNKDRKHWRLGMKLHWIDIVVYLIYLGLFELAMVAGQNTTLSYVALCLSLACAIL
jgi:hypothetical protein